MVTLMSCNSNLINCEKYKLGDYKLRFDKNEILITRDRLYQTEYYLGDSTKYEIEWISDCEYKLNLVETSITSDLSELDTLIRTEILETYESGYKFKSVGNTNSNPFEGIISMYRFP